MLSAPYAPAGSVRHRAFEPSATEILTLPSKGGHPRSAGAHVYILCSALAVAVLLLAAVLIIPRFLRSARTGTDGDEIAAGRPTSRDPSAGSKGAPQNSDSSSSQQGSNAPAESRVPAGHWRGEWRSPRGTVYDAEVQLGANRNVIQGEIKWTLRSTNGQSLRAKVGLTGVEYVQGEFEPAVGSVTMTGYSEDDPHQIVTPDKYRLTMSADGSQFIGVTFNHGGWDAKLQLTRVSPSDVTRH